MTKNSFHAEAFDCIWIEVSPNKNVANYYRQATYTHKYISIQPLNCLNILQRSVGDWRIEENNPDCMYDTCITKEGEFSHINP